MPRTCASCGAPLTGRTRRARYCDTACRVRASRRRAAEPVVEPQPVEPAAEVEPVESWSWDDYMAVRDLPAATPCYREPVAPSRQW